MIYLIWAVNFYLLFYEPQKPIVNGTGDSTKSQWFLFNEQKTIGYTYFNGFKLPSIDNMISDNRCFYCLETKKIILYSLIAK